MNSLPYQSFIKPETTTICIGTASVTYILARHELFGYTNIGRQARSTSLNSARHRNHTARAKRHDPTIDSVYVLTYDENDEEIVQGGGLSLIHI